MATAPRSAATTLPARYAWLHLAVVLGCALVYLADISPAVTTGAFGAVGLLSTTALGVGAVRNRPVLGLPWRQFLLAKLAFLVGALLRSHGQDATGFAAWLPDACTLIGYVGLTACFRGMLRAREPARDRGALADAVLVVISAALVAWLVLIAPALADPTLPLGMRIVAAVYPVIDAILLALAVRLYFTMPTAVVSWWFLAAALGSLLVGDIGYGLRDANVLVLPPLLLDAPFLASYGLAAASALHPSMRVLTSPAVATSQPLPKGRLAAVALALAAPSAMVLLRPLERPADRLVVAVGLIALGGVVLWRTVQAVNEHARSELRFAHQATHDPLTGLPNRVRLIALIDTLLQTAAYRGRAVAVLFIDLDGFKLINDSWGHPVGDELLVAAAAQLRNATRDSDPVARVGGDEFAVVCDCRSVDDALTVAQRILVAFERPFSISIGEVFVTPSIGIAYAGATSGEAAEDLIRDADTAMYRAKAGGRNRYSLFDQSMRDVVTARLQTEMALRHGLEREEFRVHYQPILELSSERVLGFEALVRWQHPERGLVGPGEFIDVIEDTDLVVPLGAFVLRTAVAQLAAWRRRAGNADWSVAVNVSPRQLRDPGLVDLVRDVLRDHGLPASALTLEITETVMLEDSDAVRGRLAALRALGVGLSVDDFGTGYSSLRYLKRFPVTTVKIDRAFIDGLGTDPDDEAIVEAVLAMARALRLKVVAEGVETVSQHERLRELGCYAGQGHLYAVPAPVPAITASPLLLSPIAQAS